MSPSFSSVRTRSSAGSALASRVGSRGARAPVRLASASHRTEVAKKPLASARDCARARWRPRKPPPRGLSVTAAQHVREAGRARGTGRGAPCAATAAASGAGCGRTAQASELARISCRAHYLYSACGGRLNSARKPRKTPHGNLNERQSVAGYRSAAGRDAARALALAACRGSVQRASAAALRAARGGSARLRRAVKRRLRVIAGDFSAFLSDLKPDDHFD